jgi:hypothetical protein
VSVYQVFGRDVLVEKTELAFDIQAAIENAAEVLGSPRGEQQHQRERHAQDSEHQRQDLDRAKANLPEQVHLV